MLVSARTPAARERREHGGHRLGLDRAAHPGPSTTTSCTPGDARRGPAPRRRPRRGPGCAAGAAARRGVPVSTARPSRMIVTRSASRSTSLRMWLDSSTVVPAADALGDAVGEDLLHQRVQPGGRLVEHQQVDVGGERRHQRHLLPVALGVGAAALGRVEVEPLEQLLAAGVARVGAAHPQQHVDRSRRRTGWATASTSPGT